MNEIDYAARVAKGAALLDEKRPEPSPKASAEAEVMN